MGISRDPTTESTKGRGFVTDWPYVQRHTGIRDFNGNVVVYNEVHERETVFVCVCVCVCAGIRDFRSNWVAYDEVCVLCVCVCVCVCARAHP